MIDTLLAVKTAKKWAKKIGQKEAVIRLLSRGVAISTAEKICAGRYGATPRVKLAKVLLREMLKDGFSFTDEKAS